MRRQKLAEVPVYTAGTRVVSTMPLPVVEDEDGEQWVSLGSALEWEARHLNEVARHHAPGGNPLAGFKSLDGTNAIRPRKGIRIQTGTAPVVTAEVAGITSR